MSRGNAKAKMGLNKSIDYKTLVMTEMTRVTDLYLKLKEYGSILTPGYEEVFYNANRDLNYQITLIISAVCNDDSDEDVQRKIQMVSKFVDDFASIRIFNFKKVNWNTNKYLLFRVMREIRNKDCRTVGMVLVRALRRMDVSIDASLLLRPQYRGSQSGQEIHEEGHREDPHIRLLLYPVAG